MWKTARAYSEIKAVMVVVQTQTRDWRIKRQNLSRLDCPTHTEHRQEGVRLATGRWVERVVPREQGPRKPLVEGGWEDESDWTYWAVEHPSEGTGRPRGRSRRLGTPLCLGGMEAQEVDEMVREPCKEWMARKKWNQKLTVDSFGVQGAYRDPTCVRLWNPEGRFPGLSFRQRWKYRPGCRRWQRKKLEKSRKEKMQPKISSWTGPRRWVTEENAK